MGLCGSRAVRTKGGRKGGSVTPTAPQEAPCSGPSSSSTFLRGPQRRKERRRDGTAPQPPRVEARAPEGPPRGGCCSPGSGAPLGAGARVLVPGPHSAPLPPRRAHAEPRGRASRGEKAGGQERRGRSRLPGLKDTECRGVCNGQCPLCSCGGRRVCDGRGRGFPVGPCVPPAAPSCSRPSRARVPGNGPQRGRTDPPRHLPPARPSPALLPARGAPR